MIGLLLRAATAAAAVAKVVRNPATRQAFVAGARAAGRAVRDVGRAIVRACQRGPKTTYGTKALKDMRKRGWSRQDVEEAIKQPARKVKWRDNRNRPDGTAEDVPATVYYHRDDGYVVRNDKTGDIVQVSKRNDPNWHAPWD